MVVVVVVVAAVAVAVDSNRNSNSNSSKKGNSNNKSNSNGNNNSSTISIVVFRHNVYCRTVSRAAFNTRSVSESCLRTETVRNLLFCTKVVVVVAVWSSQGNLIYFPISTLRVRTLVASLQK